MTSPSSVLFIMLCILVDFSQSHVPMEVSAFRFGDKKCHSLARTFSESHTRCLKGSSRYTCLPCVSILKKHFHSSYVSYKIVPFNLSDIGEGITEVAVKEWFVKVGDKVAQFENICEVQSDKASVTITSRYDGIITKLHYSVDDIARVGLPLVDIDTENVTEEMVPKSKDMSIETEDFSADNSRIKKLATPAVRRIASEYKVDISVVPGSGKAGRVMKEDILAYISGSSQEQPTLVSKPSVERRLVADRTETISGYSRTMVKTMTKANAVPQLVFSDELNVGQLIKLRQQCKNTAEKHDLKLTYLPFFLKAASLALTEFPILNASVNEECTEITFKSRHNIGFAMDTQNGLAVPNVKDVQNLKLLDIAVEIERLMKSGLKGAFAPNDLSDGTFSLSNIGSIGGTYMKPVLLPPELAIGALGRFQKLPRFNEKGELHEANIMCVSWAADHRVVDGATVARFSNMFKELLENPFELLLK